jgi:N-acetylmuramoyl-L-alanine amidase
MKLNTKRFLPFFIGLWAMVLCASFAPKTVPSFFYGIKTVCIDAGHGGKDPGCHGDVHKEKDVALAIALKLGALIEKNIKDVKVVYTRKTDVFVELGDRASIANKAKADLFICIHCNSACLRDKKLKKDICKPDVHGAETYVMGLHKTQANLDVAKRENSSILLEDNYKAKYDGFDPDSDEGYILMNLTQNAFLDHSIRFAARAQKHMKKLAGRNDKGVKQAGFLVLWKTAMPE